MRLSDNAPLRIVQWTTGNVGQRSIRATATNPELPALNAIPTVVADAPGIPTHNELPLTLPRGVVRL